MATKKIDLTQYGITDAKVKAYNPSYDYLFKEETNPALTGYEKGQVTESVLNGYLSTHWINVGYCRANNFESFFVERAIALLDAIEKATGKAISGRDSEETVQAFGAALIHEISNA